LTLSSLNWIIFNKDISTSPLCVCVVAPNIEGIYLSSIMNSFVSLHHKSCHATLLNDDNKFSSQFAIQEFSIARARVKKAILRGVCEDIR
jgi:hypothetical protein